MYYNKNLNDIYNELNSSKDGLSSKDASKLPFSVYLSAIQERQNSVSI